MGNSPSSINKINFEDVQHALNNKEQFMLMNTLGESEQDCLIMNTLPASQEEMIINKYLKSYTKDVQIIVYGRNNNDEKIQTKYNQLTSLGFNNVYIYTGGLFEWLLLQDIFGEKEFPTTKKQLDVLKYKPSKRLNVSLLKY
jgi:rhodanese-related sulfurtransferase